MINLWPFSRHKKQDVSNSFIEQLLYRLDEQDKQRNRMERTLEDQKKQIAQLIKRIDAATGRGAT